MSDGTDLVKEIIFEKGYLDISSIISHSYFYLFLF